MSNKFLSNLEWMALANSGNIKGHLDKLSRELADACVERDILRVQNKALQAEIQELRFATRPVKEPTQAPVPVPVIREEPKEESALDDAAQRFKLLELD